MNKMNKTVATILVLLCLIVASTLGNKVYGGAIRSNNKGVPMTENAPQPHHHHGHHGIHEHIHGHIHHLIHHFHHKPGDNKCFVFGKFKGSSGYIDLNPLKLPNGQFYTARGFDHEYRINFCGNNAGKCPNSNFYSPIVQVFTSTVNRECYNLGKAESTKVIPKDPQDLSKGIIYEYSDGDKVGWSNNVRATRVELVCDESATTPQLLFLQERTEYDTNKHFYLFKLTTKHACPKTASFGKHKLGKILISGLGILIGISFIFYCVVGFITTVGFIFKKVFLRRHCNHYNNQHQRRRSRFEREQIDTAVQQSSSSSAATSINGESPQSVLNRNSVRPMVTTTIPQANTQPQVVYYVSHPQYYTSTETTPLITNQQQRQQQQIQQVQPVYPQI